MCVYIGMKLIASGHLKKNKGVYILGMKLSASGHLKKNKDVYTLE